jgi:chorismate lyase / 3-hydroxybenzoate synthase
MAPSPAGVAGSVGTDTGIVMQQVAVAAGLHYVGAADLNALLNECRGRVLGIVGFGRQSSVHKDVASAWVDMPAIGKGPVFEVWTTMAPVQAETRGSIRGARNARILYGCVEIPEDDRADYDVLIYNSYCGIFDYLDNLGYPNLIRIWHYLPDIHLDERALERYKRFSLGRHEAFVAKGRAISTDAPAASAVGKRSGNTVICFLAAPRPGIPIENPRQVSAYSYPVQYGPRGPTFSRALYTSWDGLPQLYVSGTAAIFGHLSQHEGDAGAQADETIVNLRSVMEEARVRGLIDVRQNADLRFKVYLREPGFHAIVEAKLREAFGPTPSILYLQADICRRELLLEIEVVCAAGTRSL